MKQTYRVIVGDVAAVLPALDGESFDAVLCDPPYGLNFMGRAWDHGVPSAEVWAAVLRCLRPGAHLLAFGGTRTFHRLTCAIEDAGAEIRDCLCWLYSQGFPKSHDVSKAIDREAGAEREVVGTVESGGRMAGDPDYQSGDYGGGWHGVTAPATAEAQVWAGYGSALKPAWESITLARKPLAGTVASNALEHGTGALNIDGARIATGDDLNGGAYSSDGGRDGAAYQLRGGAGEYKQPSGRWPANVVLDAEAAAMLDEQSGESISTSSDKRNGKDAAEATWGLNRTENQTRGHNDSGGASRFFYCAKASRAEREAGLGGFEPAQVNDGRQTSIDNAYQRGDTLRRNRHPCCKPVDLCRWLATLVLPPDGLGRPRRILVPFSGSGSEMIGCLLAGWDEVVGIELSDEYAGIARARLKHWDRYRCADSEAADLEAEGQLTLW